MVEGARQIAPRDWNRLARRGFHLHHWFIAAERSGWSPRHVTVRGAEGLRGIIPAYLTDQGSLHDLHSRWLGPLQGAAARAGVNLRPIISVQAPYAVMSEPLGDPALLSTEVLHRVFDLLELRAKADGAKAIAWPCVDAGSKHLLLVGQERGYSVRYAGAGARIEVEWDSFGDYVATRSKHVRRTVRAEVEEFHSAGLCTELVSDYRVVVPEMNALYAQAFRRRNLRDAPLLRGFFEQLSLSPASDLRAQLPWHGSRLVGTSVNLITPHLLEGTFGAFAPEHRLGCAYYMDLCYEPIRLACRERIAAIDLGATALYAKVLRGAVLRRRLIMIKGTTAARHRLLGVLGQAVARRTEWKERRALGPLWGRGFQRERMPG